ncbi:MAG: undecaprenyl-diphosphate phosphatase [Stellaceae bacterium]
MTFLQAIFFAVVQGVSELFPVSSLGHAVILPAVLRWHINQDSPQFLPFLVVLHVGTAAALLIYFWREWWGLLLALLGRGEAVAQGRHLIALLVIGTLPAILLGFVFEHRLRYLFGSPVAAACFLIVNGFVLYGGERLRRRALSAVDRRELGDAKGRDALVVGLWQVLAFLPGISRSGATIVGGLLVGLRHEDAARFSFLLATPVIAGAAVLEIQKLRHLPLEAGAAAVSGGVLWIAGLVAAVTAYASTAFLMRYFRNHEENPALDPFAYYCWAAGVLALVLLTIA